MARWIYFKAHAQSNKSVNFLYIEINISLYAQKYFPRPESVAVLLSLTDCWKVSRCFGARWQTPWSKAGGEGVVDRIMFLGALRFLRCRGGQPLRDPSGHLLQHGLGHLWEVVVEGVVASVVDLNRSVRQRSRCELFRMSRFVSLIN